jgi:hypothetical protein
MGMEILLNQSMYKTITESGEHLFCCPMDTEVGKSYFFQLQHLSILNNLVLISYGSKLPTEIPYLFRNLIQKGKEYLSF